MKVLSKIFINSIDVPIINLHPELPNGISGTWQQVIQTLIKRTASTSGVMIHEVTSEVDAGRVVSYCTFKMNDTEYQNLYGILQNPVYMNIWEQRYSDLFSRIRSDQELYEIPLVVKTLELINNYGLKEIDMANLTSEVSGMLFKI
jgi:phosphoribosylglycinamide formyltransferase 1